ncbi:hypothetical protein V8E53_010927 [Lactarius tabidus]
MSIPKHGSCEGLTAGGGTESGKEKARKICTQGMSHKTIDMLSDEVLLEIFGSIQSSRTPSEVCNHPIWEWRRLAHVCQRWQQIIFASQPRLDLQLLCTYGTPVRKSLDCWPALCLVIDYSKNDQKRLTPEDEDGIFATLEQRHCMRHINLTAFNSLLKKVFAAMKEPFPALTHLDLSSEQPITPIIPHKFLGGSAALLREISFTRMSFPVLSPLISSAPNLVKLRLDAIPPKSLTSPKEMATSLATLARLEEFSMRFQRVRLTTRPVRITLPLETPVLLPTLTSFSFEGDSTYLADFLALIKTPRLNLIDIMYTGDYHYEADQLPKIIERSNFMPSRFRCAEVYLEQGKTSFYVYPETKLDPPIAFHTVQTDTGSEVAYLQVMDMGEVLCPFSAILSNVVHLEIKSNKPKEHQDNSIGGVRWPYLFHAFNAVQTLHVSWQFSKSIADTKFEEINDYISVTSPVLSALISVFLEGQNTETIEKLSATLRADDRSVIVFSDDGLDPEGSGLNNSS